MSIDRLLPLAIFVKRKLWVNVCCPSAFSTLPKSSPSFLTFAIMADTAWLWSNFLNVKGLWRISVLTSLVSSRIWQIVFLPCLTVKGLDAWKKKYYLTVLRTSLDSQPSVNSSFSSTWLTTSVSSSFFGPFLLVLLLLYSPCSAITRIFITVITIIVVIMMTRFKNFYTNTAIFSQAEAP